MKGHRRTPDGAGPRGRVPARSRLPSRLVPQQHRSFSAGASCAARSEHPGSSRNSAGASTSQAHLAPVVPTRELLGGGCAARRSLPPPSPAARTLRSRRSAGPVLKPPGWGEGNSVSEKRGSSLRDTQAPGKQEVNVPVGTGGRIMQNVRTLTRGGHRRLARGAEERN